MGVSRRGLIAAGTSSALVTATALAAGKSEAGKFAPVFEPKSHPISNPQAQSGVEREPEAHTTLVAFDLLPGIDRRAMLRWMTLLTDDIARLQQGLGTVGDPQPELAGDTGTLTGIVGFGPGLFEKLGLQGQEPEGFGRLPSFAVDELHPEWSDGDLLIQVAGEDQLAVAHAVRALIRDSLEFGQVRWLQSGFSNRDARTGGVQRNLMGQVDGTDNPVLGSDDFAQLVWISEGPKWAVGGTQLVVRRIKMKLDTWDSLGRTQQESVIGRKLDSGAPLTGTKLSDAPDFAARNAAGMPIIPDVAHIRRAAATNLRERFYRRPFNYLAEPVAGGQQEAGMLWTALAANLTEQYVPVQQRLAKFDLLNTWTVPVGSAVFAVPPAPKPGKVLGEELFA